MRTVKTSDNTTYHIDTDEQLEVIKKHCSDNGLTLSENGIEIELKKKKIKE